MTTENTNLILRLCLSIFALFLFFLAMYLKVEQNEERQQSREQRIASCKVMQDQNLKNNCLLSILEKGE